MANHFFTEEERKKLTEKFIELFDTGAPKVEEKETVCEPGHHDWAVVNVSPDDEEFDLACIVCGTETNVYRCQWAASGCRS